MNEHPRILATPRSHALLLPGSCRLLCLNFCEGIASARSRAILFVRRGARPVICPSPPTFCRPSASPPPRFNSSRRGVLSLLCHSLLFRPIRLAGATRLDFVPPPGGSTCASSPHFLTCTSCGSFLLSLRFRFYTLVGVPVPHACDASPHRMWHKDKLIYSMVR
jgi:hypothetical protein